MPTFVYMTRCDGCGHCVDICPSDIMHIDKTYRRAYNIEPNMCWECYSCVKACPQNAIDVAVMPTSRPWATVFGCFGKRRRAPSPGRSSSATAVRRTSSPRSGRRHGDRSSRRPTTMRRARMLQIQELAHEPDALNIDELPALTPDQLKQGVV